jgi:putative ABC transport system permease protein
VLGHGLRLTVIGLACGAGAALAAAPLLQQLPMPISGPTVLTIVPVALIIGTVGLLACYIPAYRAARANPMTVLRGE